MNEMMSSVKRFAIDSGIIDSDAHVTAGTMNMIYDYIGSDHRVFAGDIVRRVDLEIITAHISGVIAPTARQDQSGSAS